MGASERWERQSVGAGSRGKRRYGKLERNRMEDNQRTDFIQGARSATNYSRPLSPTRRWKSRYEQASVGNSRAPSRIHLVQRRGVEASIPDMPTAAPLPGRPHRLTTFAEPSTTFSTTVTPGLAFRNSDGSVGLSWRLVNSRLTICTVKMLLPLPSGSGSQILSSSGIRKGQRTSVR